MGKRMKYEHVRWGQLQYFKEQSLSVMSDIHAAGFPALSFQTFFCQKCQNQNQSIADGDSVAFRIWIKDAIPLIYLFPCSGLLSARHLNSLRSCLKHRNLPLFSIFVFHMESIAMIYPAGVSVLPVIESPVHTLSSLWACDGSISWYY